MTTFEVTLESRDFHKYMCYVQAGGKLEAGAKALENIKQKGWEHFGYHLLSVNPLPKNEMKKE